MRQPHDEDLIPLNAVDDSIVAYSQTEVRWRKTDEEFDTSAG